MKKVKYLIGIILICIIVFIGIELFRKIEHKEVNSSTNSSEIVEILNGQELLEKADKILTAKGWAGASNNVVGIKDNILYYYNKGTGEFKKIATGIEDIYYEGDAEEITAQKANNAEVLTQEFIFIVYK